MRTIPQRFCWTKFGTEAGETIGEILARKEQERSINGGTFLWGVGNSIAPGIRELVRVERRPLALFSPMRAKPKSIDTSPGSVVLWRSARTLDGTMWRIPSASVVTSRGAMPTGEAKRTHYALVCNSDGPITSAEVSEEIRMSSLANLVSGAPLGYSQVTSVVHRKKPHSSSGPTYQVGFWAKLIYPYFVALGSPVPASVGSTLLWKEEMRAEPPQFTLELR